MVVVGVTAFVAAIPVLVIVEAFFSSSPMVTTYLTDPGAGAFQRRPNEALHSQPPRVGGRLTEAALSDSELSLRLGFGV